MRQASRDHAASNVIAVIANFAHELNFGKIPLSIVEEAKAVMDRMGSDWELDVRKNNKRKWVNI